MASTTAASTAAVSAPPPSPHPATTSAGLPLSSPKHATRSSSSVASSLVPAAPVPLAFDPAMLLTPTFDPHTFITSTTSLSPSTTLPALHASLSSYTSQLHLQLVAYLNLHYEEFIALSSSLNGVSELLSTIEEWGVEVKEKAAAVSLVVEEGRREVEARLQEREQAEERARWLKELQDVVERVKRIQAVMGEMEEEIQNDQLERAVPAPGDDDADILLAVQPGMRAAVRRALDKYKAGGGAEERRRREERRQKRKEDGALLASDEEDDDEDEDDDADESVKRQHNAAYDLFLTILAGPAQGTDSQSPSPSLLAHLTHLTLLFISLNASLSFTSSFSLVSSLSPTIASLTSSFHTHLSSALLSAIRSSSSSALTQVLRLYVLLDSRHLAQSIIKEQLIAPATSPIISQDRLRSTSLSSLYDQLLDLASSLLPLLTESSSFAPGAFDWFNDFFSLTSAQLVALGPALFAPGNAQLFHAHYLATLQYIRSLETLIRAHQSSLDRSAIDQFVKRWNTSIYFRLRFQAIAGAVESQCGKGGEDGAKGATDAVKQGLLQCWSEGVWLEELSSQFIKLSVQIVERYAVMVEQGCVVTQSKGGDGGEDGGMTSALPINALLSLYVDVKEVADFLQGTVTRLILSRVGTDKNELVTATLAPAVARLGGLLPLLLNTLTSLLSHQAAAPLAQIARLPTLYRMNTKRPTAPSPYIAQLIRTLSTSITTLPPLARWSSSDRHSLLLGTLTSLASLMVERATAVLELAVRTEASLRMLRRGAGTAGGGDTSEVDKIRAQLELDVKELQRAAREELGVGDVTELNQLLSTLRSAGLSSSTS